MSDIQTPEGKIAQYVKEQIPAQVKEAVDAIPRPENGADGQDGIGFNVKSWEGGIYREGSIVQHNIGQSFKALRDTNSEPGRGDDWERIGQQGFRWTGVKNADFGYQDGDLYIDGGTTFLFWEGKGRMLAQRGKNGKDGVDGTAGADGKDAAKIVHVKWDQSGIVFAFDDGEILTADIEGLEAIQKRLTFLEGQLVNQVEDIDAPIKRFAGTWKVGDNYAIGDTAKFNKGLYLCIKADRNSNELDPDHWVKLAGAGAGGIGTPNAATKPSVGGAGYSDPSGFTITTPDSFTKVTAPTVDMGPQRGFSQSASELTYTGASTSSFRLSCEMTVQGVGGSDVSVELFINGAPITPVDIFCEQAVVAPGAFTQVCFSGYAALSTSDKVSIFVQTLSGDLQLMAVRLMAQEI